MFLNILNDEQKKLFLKLAIKAAEANDIITDEEKNMISSFAKEMQIQPFYSVNENMECLLNRMCCISSTKTKRIFLFEILGIIFSDSEYDDKEKNFISEIIKAFNIEESVVTEMTNIINEYTHLYKKITSIIFE